MLVVVSDLHMTDRTTGGAVSAADLVEFTEQLSTLQPRNDPLTLLLLGDVVDLLRSEQWGSLWLTHSGAAPWSALGPQFSGFAGGLQEQALLAVIAGIERRYERFFEALRQLKATRATQIRYVIGNHDFMVQLSPKARVEIVRLFSLDQSAEHEFPLEYEDRGLDLYADHGHRHDALNFHRAHAGLWAIGDAIVLRVVNEFARAARKKLHLTSNTPLGRAVDEIDNVEPHFLIPLYVEWLATTRLVSAGEREELRGIWRTTVNEFLALDYFREERYGSQADVVRWIRTLYGLVDLAPMLGFLAKIPLSLTRDGHVQQGHAVKHDAAVRVFGHTHAPGVVALPEVGGKRRFYLNTGTWRTTTTRVSFGAGLDFASQRVSSFLVVRGAGNFELIRRVRCP